MIEEERNEIEESGGLDLDGIHIMTIAGEIKGIRVRPREPRQQNMST